MKKEKRKCNFSLEGMERIKQAGRKNKGKKRNMTPEWRAKFIAGVITHNIASTGKPHKFTEEGKRRHQQANEQRRGKKRSPYNITPEGREKLVQAGKAHAGRKQSREHIEKKAAAIKGKPNPAAREWCIYLNSSGELLESSIEKKVKSILIDLDVAFKQHRPFSGIGVADFYLQEYSLVIECDGDYWHSKPKAIKRDQRKDILLKSLGIKVLRLPESLIKKEEREARNRIMRELGMIES